MFKKKKIKDTTDTLTYSLTCLSHPAYLHYDVKLCVNQYLCVLHVYCLVDHSWPAAHSVGCKKNVSIYLTFYIYHSRSSKIWSVMEKGMEKKKKIKYTTNTPTCSAFLYLSCLSHPAYSHMMSNFVAEEMNEWSRSIT